jgi:hypothetical protein
MNLLKQSMAASAGVWTAAALVVAPVVTSVTYPAQAGEVAVPSQEDSQEPSQQGAALKGLLRPLRLQSDKQPEDMPQGPKAGHATDRHELEELYRPRLSQSDLDAREKAFGEITLEARLRLERRWSRSAQTWGTLTWHSPPGLRSVKSTEEPGPPPAACSGRRVRRSRSIHSKPCSSGWRRCCSATRSSMTSSRATHSPLTLSSPVGGIASSAGGPESWVRVVQQRWTRSTPCASARKKSVSRSRSFTSRIRRRPVEERALSRLAQA